MISIKILFPEKKSIILYLPLRYISDKNEVKIPIEKIIENIMMEIPFSTKGFITFNYNLKKIQILIKQNQ